MQSWGKRRQKHKFEQYFLVLLVSSLPFTLACLLDTSLRENAARHKSNYALLFQFQKTSEAPARPLLEVQHPFRVTAEDDQAIKRVNFVRISFCECNSSGGQSGDMRPRADKSPRYPPPPPDPFLISPFLVPHAR